MIDNILNYIYLIMVIVMLFMQIVMVLIGRRVNKSNGKKPAGFDNLLKLFNEIIPNAIKFAEENNVNGATKKTVALSKIMLECSKLGIDYNKNIEKIDKSIEDLISLTKEVNRVNVINKVSE